MPDYPVFMRFCGLWNTVKRQKHKIRNTPVKHISRKVFFKHALRVLLTIKLLDY